jgi:hypothetical protein
VALAFGGLGFSAVYIDHGLICPALSSWYPIAVHVALNILECFTRPACLSLGAIQ